MSSAITLYLFRLGTYWSSIATGELAAYLTATDGTTSPLFVGRSRNSGGFAGFGAQAAARASVPSGPPPAPRPRPLAAAAARAARISSIDFTSSAADGWPLRPGRTVPSLRQHELSAYSEENTSGRFMPMRSAP